MELNAKYIKRFLSLRALHFRRRIVTFFRNTSFYPFLYRSYWHKILCNKSNSKNECEVIAYYTARLHIGAGVGHQISNWNSAYWYAKKFNLKFAHSPFSTKKWDDFLGFGEHELLAKDLVKKGGYKKRRLPLFSNEEEMELNREIIASYKGEKILFVAEQDQGYTEQIGVMEDIKYKFHNAMDRKYDQLTYSKENLNIALHIRRGDIMVDDKVNPVYEMRYQNNSYYINILNSIIHNSNVTKPICIYLFSQGEESDFDEFKVYDNIKFCLKMDQYKSFLHLVNADVLLISKSGFSYFPALMSDNIIICPADFWHGYPTSDRWILADSDGLVDEERLNKAMKLTV